MRLLILIPALFYLALLIINLGIFTSMTEINFFWLFRFNIPVVIFVSLFFILYIILIWAVFNFSNMFSNMKAEKLEKEVFELKSKLLSKQGDLIDSIEGHFQKTLEAFKSEADQKLELYKKENDKVVSNMNYQMGVLKDKTDKIVK